MKKIIFAFSLLIFGAITLSGCQFYEDNVKGETYYTKIVTTPDKQTDKNNESYYEYHQIFVSDTGKTVNLTMKEFRDKPLRKDAYLKAKVVKNDGVKNWSEVSKDSVPKKALEVMEK